MFATMAFLNFIVGSCYMAFQSSSPSVDAVFDSEYDPYELLSTEVILPLSLLMQSTQARVRARHQQRRRSKRDLKSVSRGLLGSAAIASVIDLVGPILPFAGGVDLRRLHPYEILEWLKSYFSQSGYSPIVHTFPRGGSSSSIVLDSSADTIAARSHGKVTKDPMQQVKQVTTSYYDKDRPLVLAATEPFLPLDEIAKLNLEDIAQAFKFATESPDASKEKTASYSISERMEQLLNSIKEAADKSRGVGILPAQSTFSTTPIQPAECYGDMDATLFCAALRVFAEWRMLRTVPEGYKSYSVGMALGLKDVVQNVGKVEVVIKQWIDVKRSELQGSKDSVLRGPTLRQLLEYERDNNVHKNLPRLNGGSAIGLLWSVRQLRYQSAVFQNILDTPSKYSDTKAAVGAAYTQVYDKYHGWAVQKIFNYSFRAAPDASLIFNNMDPLKLQEITNGATRWEVVKEESVVDKDVVCASSTPPAILEEVDEPELYHSVDSSDYLVKSAISVEWTQSFTEHDCGVTGKKGNLFVDLGHNISKEWAKLGHNLKKIGHHIDKELGKTACNWMGEWDNFMSALHRKDKVHVADSGLKSLNSTPSRGGSDDYNENQVVYLEGAEMEMYIAKEMESHIREQITSYLRLLKPILFDLSELFDEMNMDDPSKV